MKELNADEYDALKATFFDQLASYYKYRNPKFFIQAYKKHYEYVQKLNTANHKTMEFYKPIQTQQKTYLRFLHAAPNESNIDVVVNGLPILPKLSFKNSSNYIELPAGKHKIEIFLSANPTESILSETISIDVNHFYTLVFTEYQHQLLLLQYNDQPSLPLGETKIRFIHLATNSPKLSLAVKQGEGDVVFSNLAVHEVSDYLPISPMTVNLEIRLAGTKNILYPLYKSKFEQNKIYDIIAVGLANDNPKFDVMIIN